MSTTTTTTTAGGEGEVDVGLFNRQIYAIGMSAMKRMIGATYVFLGCDAVAAETAKNVILSGVKKIVLSDSTKMSWDDLGANCFANESHMKEGTSRAEVVAAGIAQLNTAAIVEAKPTMSAAELEALNPTAIILTNQEGILPVEELSAIEALRTKGVKLLYLSTAGVFVKIFNDFGDQFTVMEPLGEEPVRYYVAGCEEKEKPKTAEADEGKEEPAAAMARFALQVDITDHDLAIYDNDLITLTLPSRTNSADDKTSLDCRVAVRETKEIITVEVPEAGEAAERLRGYKGGAYVISRDVPKEMQFSSYTAAHATGQDDGETKGLRVRGDDQVPTVLNFSRFSPDEGFNLFYLLNQFERKFNRRPKPYNADDLASMKAIYIETYDSQNSKKLQDDPEFEKALTKFTFTAATQLPAFTSFVGGIVAQEVLKSASLKFVPIHQFWFFDLREMVPVTFEEAEGGAANIKVKSFPLDAEKLSGDRYQSQISFWGKKVFTGLTNSNIFVVGSGAIGCEYIKILALAGIGAGPKGKLVVTDNDRIERSNLSRQFLFRNEHVGHFKSQVACEAAKKINKSLKLRVLTDKVMPATAHPINGIFNQRFWSGLSAIATAVDNVAARDFLDDMALSFRKPMIDSGTLGAMGHVETILPFMTARLKDTSGGGDTAKKIPFCTLHFFPTTIDHCIQYATDMFAAWFTGAPGEANKFLNSKNFDAFHDGLEAGARLTVYKGLFATLSSVPKTLEECAAWVRCQFESSFVNSIKQVLHSYPPDKKEEDGKPYWGGARKLPKVITFDWDENPNHKDYVLYGTILLAEMYNISPGENAAAVLKDSTAVERIKKAATTCDVPEFVPSKLTIPTAGGDDSANKKEDQQSEKETDSNSPAAAGSSFDEQVSEITPKMRSLFDGLKGTKDFTSFPFEKDDDQNGHVEFITSVSNIRASCYDIPPEDAHHTKKVAGRIIPAMITTTAAVTGLAALQLYNALLIPAKSTPTPFGSHKSMMMDDICARNFSIGVAEMSSTQMFECKSAAEKKVFEKSTDEARAAQRFCTWERFEIKTPADVNLATVIKAFEEKYPGLIVDQLVEVENSIWIYNRTDKSESMEKALGFPLLAWTEIQIPKKGEEEQGGGGEASTAPSRTSYDFVVRCSAKDPEDVVSAVLPQLRYEVLRKA